MRFMDKTLNEKEERVLKLLTERNMLFSFGDGKRWSFARGGIGQNMAFEQVDAAVCQRLLKRNLIKVGFLARTTAFYVLTAEGRKIAREDRHNDDIR
jgi:hypothetical protein